ncbi:TPA: type II toxin-antitoxin system VapC family toxin [Candidatus Bathyarchaeota archaeon]|nr:type II toxin-antitoxin system VapC family toxin [Candidatus Bathyarchaeota archaeon]
MRNELTLLQRKTAVKIVVDSYAWIEVFIGSRKGMKAKELLIKAEEIYTPDTVMAEIARKYFREGNDEETILDRLRAITETSAVTSIDVETALESAKCCMELLERARKARMRTPSLFDAIVLATARRQEAKILTGDEHLRDLPETLWMG